MAVHYNRGATFPEPPDLSPDPLIDLLAQTNAKVEDFAISPDGKRIAYVSAQSGSYDLWLVNIDGSHNRRLVDSYPIQCFFPAWSPDGQWIAYATRYDAPTGNIFKVCADGSEPPINLTYDNSPARNAETVQWTPDGKSIIFLRPSSKGYTQLASISTEIPTGKIGVRYITDEEWNNAEFQLSPDGKWIAFQSDRSGFVADNTRMDIWLIPIEGGYARNLTPNTRDHHDSSPRWSPNGKQLAFVSDRSGWRNIGIIDVATGKTTTLTKSPWDEENPQWSPEGQWLAYVARRDWNFHIMKVSTDGRGQPIQLTQGEGVNGGFKNNQVRGSLGWTPDGKEIVYTHMNWHRCNDLWAIPAQGGAPRQITNHMPPDLDQEMFVKPELIKYKSKDGLEVPAFLYRPPNARGKTPLLIFARANTHGFHVNGFYPFIQYLVHKGYTVIAPEVRGSGGAGRKYEMLNFGDWGGGDVDDFVAGAEHLAAQGLVDINRVVMHGGSTGGYFTAMTLSRYPDLLKAAVVFYGPPDVVHMQNYGSASGRTTLWDVVGGEYGGPEQALEHWKERSAINYVDKVKTPVLILWGDRDGVRVSMADDYFKALKEKGKYAEYILYNAEPHGWYDWRPETVADAIRRVEAHYRKFVEL